MTKDIQIEGCWHGSVGVGVIDAGSGEVAIRRYEKVRWGEACAEIANFCISVKFEKSHHQRYAM